MNQDASHLRILHRLVLKQPVVALGARASVVVATTRKGVFLWNGETGQALSSIKDFDEGARQGVIEFDVSPDASLIATGVADLTTKAYATETGQRLARLSKVRKGYHNAAEQLRFSVDGRLLFTAMGRAVTVWSVDDWQEVRQLKGHTSKVHLLEIVGGENTGLLVSAAGRYVKIWDVGTGEERLALPAFKRVVGSLAVSADGKTLAVGGEDGLVTLWSLPDGEQLQSYVEHSEYVFGLAVSPNGELVASSDMEGMLSVWRASDASTISQQAIGCAKPEFSADGQLVAAASEEQAILLDAEQGTLLATLPEAFAVRFFGNGQVVTAEGPEVVIRDLQDAQA